MLERVLVKRLRDTEEDDAELSLPSKKSSADGRPTDILTADKPSEGQVRASNTLVPVQDETTWSSTITDFLSCCALIRQPRVLG